MEREARKRKILSRGADRLALITGRIQSLDPNPYSESGSFPTRPTDHLPAQQAQSSSEPRSTNDQSCSQDSNHVEVGNDEKFFKEVASPIRVADMQSHEEREISQDYANGPKRPFGGFLHSISPREINQSIISSENTRVICSVAVAVVVVVLSLFNLPHNVVNQKSLIAYRPLYVVLLTDLLVIVARLSQRKEGVKGGKSDRDGDNWTGAIKLMELGLVLVRIVRAIFIDCSFYLVIVVCGLSLF